VYSRILVGVLKIKTRRQNRFSKAAFLIAIAMMNSFDWYIPMIKRVTFYDVHLDAACLQVTFPYAATYVYQTESFPWIAIKERDTALV
jgi:hypothetical protein